MKMTENENYARLMEIIWREEACDARKKSEKIIVENCIFGERQIIINFRSGANPK